MPLGLNLAGADLSNTGFEAIPSATYHCSVVKIDLKETSGSGSLPKGTPMINVQFKVEGGEFNNRRLFRQLIIAPAKIAGKPYEHKAVMDRILGQFFECLGFSKDEITTEGFDPDPEDLYGRELLVVVGQKAKYNPNNDPALEGVMDNEVKGFRSLTSASSGSGLI